jgi:hypothetical protein
MQRPIAAGGDLTVVRHQHERRAGLASLLLKNTISLLHSIITHMEMC